MPAGQTCPRGDRQHPSAESRSHSRRARTLTTQTSAQGAQPHSRPRSHSQLGTTTRRKPSTGASWSPGLTRVRCARWPLARHRRPVGMPHLPPRPIAGPKAAEYVWRSVRQSHCGLLAHLEVLVPAELTDGRVDEIPHRLHGLRLPKADGLGASTFENVLCRTMPAGNSLTGGVAACTACRTSPDR